jgi:23S rRNA (adenine2503-C2)-methyltransferase
MSEERPLVFDLSVAGLQERLQAWGEPAYRARQVYRHLYVNLAAGPAQMTDLPATLRSRMELEWRWTGMRPDRILIGDDGLTRKALFTLDDGSPVETVLMVYPDRSTVCVSSQSGCPMACVFCATGQLGFLHDLTPGQIVEQVLWAERQLRDPQFHTFKGVELDSKGRRLNNVVFMGMGEPFNNYDNWWEAVERLHDPAGFNLGARAFTVSTVGLVPGILRLAEEKLPVNLAVSLHAPNDALRSALMPVNKRWPIAEVLGATRAYLEKTGRRVSFEYVLLHDKNDQPDHAAELADRLNHGRTPGRPLLFHVNLIPWNPVPGAALSRPHRQRVLAFQNILERRNIPCTVRVERGVEIAAACGQLAGRAVAE